MAEERVATNVGNFIFIEKFSRHFNYAVANEESLFVSQGKSFVARAIFASEASKVNFRLIMITEMRTRRAENYRVN